MNGINWLDWIDWIDRIEWIDYWLDWFDWFDWFGQITNTQWHAALYQQCLSCSAKQRKSWRHSKKLLGCYNYTILYIYIYIYGEIPCQLGATHPYSIVVLVLPHDIHSILPLETLKFACWKCAWSIHQFRKPQNKTKSVGLWGTKGSLISNQLWPRRGQTIEHLLHPAGSEDAEIKALPSHHPLEPNLDPERLHPVVQKGSIEAVGIYCLGPGIMLKSWRCLNICRDIPTVHPGNILGDWRLWLSCAGSSPKHAGWILTWLQSWSCQKQLMEAKSRAEIKFQKFHRHNLWCEAMLSYAKHLCGECEEGSPRAPVQNDMP